ncbi:TcfC E-set like domain-containing protein [Edaphovirga cremea]|uniref:TcfC E-set like domain-containing protein n=1 Tax=Edaphovirga cremea TaxID=2267246 RepID=UPI000DEF66F9|nr:TcfC E-set like domain-containing protein [Edaphovirga cremea]
MRRNLLALLCLSVIGSGSCDASTKIPPGFEILARGEQESVDVILAGKHVGRFDAIVSLDNVQFSEPDKVLAALGLSIKPLDKEYQTLLQGLSAPLARHGEDSCGYLQKNAGCGFLQTDSVAAIYDESEDSVTLFLRKDWLPNNNEQNLYLTPTTNNVENALIHEQNFNVVSQGDYKSLYLQGVGALGVTDNSYIGAHWSFDASQDDDENENNADVSDLYYRYDINQRFYTQLGRMDNRTLFNAQGGNFAFTFLPLGAIDGMRVGSTLSYLNKAEASQGTPVTVLLSRNSRVDAYRNNQLLGTFYLSAGNQNIDTSNFPNGSYSVQLRIYESNQLVRTEISAFTKTGSLSDGHIQWFLQGGRISDTDEDEQKGSAFQAGFRIPLAATLNNTVGVASVDNQKSIEVGLDYSVDQNALGSLGLSGNVYRGDEDMRGDSEQITYSKNSWPTLSFYRYRTSGDQCNDTQNNDSNDYNTLGCYESINATVNYNVKGWNLILGYIQSQNHADTETPYQSDKSFEDNMLNQTTENSTSRTYQFSGSHSFTRGDWVMSTTLGAFHRNDDGYEDSDNGIYVSLSFSQSPHQDSAGKSQTTNLDVNYRSSHNDGNQTSYNVSHTWYDDQNSHRELELQAGGINTDTVDSAVTGRVDGQYGNLTGTLSDSYDTKDNDHTTAFSGSYNSTVAVSRHGIYWGGQGTGDPASGVVVNVDNIDDDDNSTQVDAQASGSALVHLTAGRSALLPLASFEEGSVEVRDSSSVNSGGSTTELLTGAGARDVLLLPGKLSRRKVSVDHSYGYIGNLLLPIAAKANPILGINSKMLLLSEDGSFTAELSTKSAALYLISGENFYQCPLNVKKQRLVVRYVGSSTCQSIALQAMPDSVRDLAVVKMKRTNEMETASNR